MQSKTVVMEQEQMGFFDFMKELAIGDTKVYIEILEGKD